MYSTPKRLRWFFETKQEANLFAEMKKNDGYKDVIVVIVYNKEDLCRDEFKYARIEGASVIWTEHTYE